MPKATRTLVSICFALVVALAACTGGEDGGEGMYNDALLSVNKEWQLSEVKKDGDKTIVRVEVGDNVPFAEGKKAMEAIQKVDPKFNGFVEFFNSEVGMTIRKVEIFPGS